MDEESIFRVLFGVSFLTMMVYRLSQHLKAKTYQGNSSLQAEGKLLNLVRVGFVVPFLWAVFSYLFAPERLTWAALPVPSALRWVGMGLLVLSLPLLVWVHQALARNFSTTLRIRPDHTLVTSGPYRWVRHPMYTVFCLMFAGVLVGTANWFLGGLALLALALIMLVRTPKEEAQLLERFGDDYRQYMQRTGRYLPRLAWPSR